MVHLELRNVSKFISRRVAGGRISAQILAGVDLTADRGDLITIMGPSGSGKTTLLRLINRLAEADSGIVLLNGRDTREFDPQELRRKIGMVFQLPIMFNGSVLENIGFGTKLWGTDIDLEALSDDCGIPRSLLNADATQLSVGEKQRVCIARALANGPEVLLLDEPTSSLDAASADKIEKLLLKLKTETNLTMLWVTHEREQAERIDGRRLMLREGRLERE